MNELKKYYKITLCTILIGILCFIPGSEFREVKINIPHLDKVIHFIMFYGLGLLIQAALENEKSKRNLFLLIGIIYGGLIELIQHYFIAMRSGDIVDFIMDASGLLLGIISYTYYPRFMKKML